MYEDDDLETRPLAEETKLEGVPGDNDAESLRPRGENPRRRTRRHLNTCVILALLVISNTISGLVGTRFGRWTRDLDSTCARYTTQYSPVLDEVGVEYSVVRFNSTFMHEDVYRRRGSPEVDAAWEALGVDYRAGVISREEGLQSGLTLGHVQRSPKYGSGFFVNVEGLHHLHCLNLVRKSLYYNYPYYKDLGTHAFTNDDDIVQLHVSHCLDILRQVLMCNTDTGVLGQVWYNNNGPQAFPDFNTRHKCKNFDGIRKWAEAHQAPEIATLPPDYMQAPDPKHILEEIP